MASSWALILLVSAIPTSPPVAGSPVALNMMQVGTFDSRTDCTEVAANISKPNGFAAYDWGSDPKWASVHYQVICVQSAGKWNPN
jgi:hypothetical protein